MTMVALRLVVNDRKFPASTVFFSHTKPASSNNPRSYTIVSAQPNRLSGSNCSVSAQLFGLPTCMYLLLNTAEFIQCLQESGNLASSTNGLTFENKVT